jgi:hypothetical protein
VKPFGFAAAYSVILLALIPSTYFFKSLNREQASV